MPDIPTWRIEDTVKLAGILAAHGVDLLDVSSGANHPKQSIKGSLAHTIPHQVQFSEAVKRAHPGALLVGAVGGITTGTLAQDILEKEQADVVFVGRQFQRDPASVWTFADQLGVHVKLANQIEWGVAGRGSLNKKTHDHDLPELKA